MHAIGLFAVLQSYLCRRLNTWQQSVQEINVSGLALNRNRRHITHSQLRAQERQTEREREKEDSILK